MATKDNFPNPGIGQTPGVEKSQGSVAELQGPELEAGPTGQAEQPNPLDRGEEPGGKGLEMPKLDKKAWHWPQPDLSRQNLDCHQETRQVGGTEQLQ